MSDDTSAQEQPDQASQKVNYSGREAAEVLGVKPWTLHRAAQRAVRDRQQNPGVEKVGRSWSAPLDWWRAQLANLPKRGPKPKPKRRPATRAPKRTRAPRPPHEDD